LVRAEKGKKRCCAESRPRKQWSLFIVSKEKRNEPKVKRENDVGKCHSSGGRVIGERQEEKVGQKVVERENRGKTGKCSKGLEIGRSLS